MIALLALLSLSLNAPEPPLCRVVAAQSAELFGLRTVIVGLRPGCPKTGRAYVRLQSSSGATDPPNDWLELSDAVPSHPFLGVLSIWRPQWRSASGKSWPVPERGAP